MGSGAYQISPSLGRRPAGGLEAKKSPRRSRKLRGFRPVGKVRVEESFSGRSGDYFGAMRIAPSRRIVSPFSISFSMICWTSAANSSGRPSRDGNGIC
jgi:hypothetical protein